MLVQEHHYYITDTNEALCLCLSYSRVPFLTKKQCRGPAGFLETVKQKVQCGEIKEGDAIMADKGFDIGDNLAKLKLKLNFPPFLRDKVGFEEGDVIKMQTVA